MVLCVCDRLQQESFGDRALCVDECLLEHRAVVCMNFVFKNVPLIAKVKFRFNLRYDRVFNYSAFHWFQWSVYTDLHAVVWSMYFTITL